LTSARWFRKTRAASVNAEMLLNLSQVTRRLSLLLLLEVLAE
jgi:hypothetical protein